MVYLRYVLPKIIDVLSTPAVLARCFSRTNKTCLQVKKMYRKKRKRYHSVKKSYFDWLSDDEISHVLRFTSDMPWRVSWIGFLDLTTVKNIVISGGPLADCARRVFSKLEVSESEPEKTNSLLFLGPGQESRVEFRKALRFLGSSVDQIRITRPTFPGVWMPPLISNCSNLKHLSVVIARPECTKIGKPYVNRFSLPDFLNAHGGNLESLEIGWIRLSESDISAISKHCTSLKRLGLEFDAVHRSVSKIWQALRESLVNLSIGTSHRSRNADFKIWHISNSCFNLRRLRFSNIPYTFGNNIMFLCIACGEHLESLSLKKCKLDLECYGQISQACPNVIVDVYATYGLSTRHLVALGSRLNRMNIGRNTLDGGGENLKVVGQSCVNVSDVSLDYWDTSLSFRYFFASPKRNLKVFRATNMKREKNDVMQVLAENVNSLEVLEFQGDVQQMYAVAVVLATNREIRKVRITVVGGCDFWFSGVETLPSCDPLRPAGLRPMLEFITGCPLLDEVHFTCTRCKFRNDDQILTSEDLRGLSLSYSRYRELYVRVCRICLLIPFY